MALKFPPATKIAGDFQFLEGPVWVPARNELLFSDIPASRIYRCRDGRVDVFREPSGKANGNTLAPDGRLVTCEHENRRVSRTEPDGAVVAVATHYQGRRLNSPNDVACRSDGSIYFTDPPYGVQPELRELDFQGLYRIGVQAPQPQLLVADFVKPNGLAFSPDEKILYCADTELNHVRAFDVAADGSLSNGRRFCKARHPDGMRMDVEGNLWIAAMAAVEVFDRAGRRIGKLSLAEQPANLAFGDLDRMSLYVTARTGLYKVRVPIPGVA
jgi:sugar lactone lactonase YvrE